MVKQKIVEIMLAKSDKLLVIFVYQRVNWIKILDNPIDLPIRRMIDEIQV